MKIGHAGSGSISNLRCQPAACGNSAERTRSDPGLPSFRRDDDRHRSIFFHHGARSERAMIGTIVGSELDLLAIFSSRSRRIICYQDQ